MNYSAEVRILYSDTDAYGVVWHGAYTKWFEAGRVELSEKLGLPLEDLEKQGVTFPVVELNIRYKSSAMFNEKIIIETSIEEVKNTTVKFKHIVKEKETQKLRTIATSTIVAVDKQGKLYRKLPENIYSCFENAVNQTVSA
ncbi:MAG: acyl-CoA thioesterase [Candidatus Gastranaerophilales bacterium]|nr:acyl-CoA thioesterase [Candidatus Gastranaerophilales bacterium]